MSLILFEISGSTISTLLHDRINPKDCQLLSLGDTGFLQFFRVVSRDYGKPRIFIMLFWRILDSFTPPNIAIVAKIAHENVQWWRWFFLFQRWDMDLFPGGYLLLQQLQGVRLLDLHSQYFPAFFFAEECHSCWACLGGGLFLATSSDCKVLLRKLR